MRKILSILWVFCVTCAFALAQSSGGGSGSGQASTSGGSGSGAGQGSSGGSASGTDQSSSGASSGGSQNSSGGASSGGSQSSSGGSSMDKQFMMKAAQDGQAEVAMGQLAQQKGSSDQVKQLGQQLVTDHQQSNTELQQLASQEGVQLPQGPDAKHSQAAQKLGSMSGTDFDKAFLKQAVKDHQTDVKEFQKEANSGKDPQSKAFAQKNLPTLQNHLQMAQQAMSAVGGNSGKSKSSGGQ